MKRWGRILLNTLTAISLLLALATACAWVQSYMWPKSWINVFQGGGPSSWYGEVGYTWQWSTHDPITAHHIRFAGLRWEREEVMGGFSTADVGALYQSEIMVHWAWPTSFCAALATALVLSRRKSATGHCPACGYDMRANPARCSECGHEPAPAA